MAHALLCPFLAADEEGGCIAGSEAYRPSSFERGEYCLNVRYVICPIYCVSTGGRYPAGHQATHLAGRTRS